MAPSFCCPACRSGNVMGEGERHVCKDCGHEFVSKRLFISYGHDAHASLAIRLRDDLRARGHEVWFDEERLNPGHDWEMFIEQGLEDVAAEKENGAMILLLTPHSVRRPDGYCLNELHRAQHRKIPIIPLMVVNCEPPLSICRLQRLDMRKCIPINEKEGIYREQFAKLLKALEENQFPVDDSLRCLLEQLPRLDFDADILRHEPRFVGLRQASLGKGDEM